MPNEVVASNQSDALSDVETIKKGINRKSGKAFIGFSTLMFFGYLLPIMATGKPSLTALSALFAVIGAATLWWESNHSDVQVAPDFAHLTGHKSMTIPGVGFLTYYFLVVSVFASLGIALCFFLNHSGMGRIMMFSVLMLAIFGAGGAVAWHRFNSRAYELQSVIRIDIEYIKALPSKQDVTQAELVEASVRLKRASSLARNALRSTGFFFLLVSGIFVIVDETIKNASGIIKRLLP